MWRKPVFGVSFSTVILSPFPDRPRTYRLCRCDMRSQRAPGSGWRRNTRSRVCSSTCTRGGDGEEDVVKPSINKLSPTPAPASTCCFGHAKRACCHILATSCPRTACLTDCCDSTLLTTAHTPFFFYKHIHKLQNGRRLCSRHRVSTYHPSPEYPSTS